MLTVTQPVKNFLEKMYAEPYMGIGHKMRKDSALGNGQLGELQQRRI